MITAGLTNSFKEQLLLGVHDFSTDTLKMALTIGCRMSCVIPDFWE